MSSKCIKSTLLDRVRGAYNVFSRSLAGFREGEERRYEGRIEKKNVMLKERRGRTGGEKEEREKRKEKEGERTGKGRGGVPHLLFYKLTTGQYHSK